MVCMRIHGMEGTLMNELYVILDGGGFTYQIFASKKKAVIAFLKFCGLDEDLNFWSYMEEFKKEKMLSYDPDNGNAKTLETVVITK